MKLLKLLFVVVALLSIVPCFGKQIPLRGNWEKTKKSISINLPMDASIEEGSGELIVNFHEDLGLVYVTVMSENGNIIYNAAVQTSEMTSWTLSLKELCEKGSLSITNGENNVFGDFSI